MVRIGDIIRSLENNNAVSEVIGAMLILLILVVFLGTVQVYEVPGWNKELEMQQFDIVHSDFINMRSNLEEVIIKNIPKTSSLHMGVRYPQRFMLQNPGPGAYGTIRTYPLNINVSYKLSNGSFSFDNYTTTGIIYELDGLSTFPELVYEHGIVIKDFGKTNNTNDEQSLVINNEVFIPVLYWNYNPVSSLETESFNIKPFNETARVILNISITMETRYPMIWKELLNNTISNISDNKITISINNPNGKEILLPQVFTSPDAIYASMIQFRDIPALTVPPFSNIDPAQPLWPSITNITIVNNATNYYDINALVKNATGLSSIYADFTDFTGDPAEFKVSPDYPIAGTWSLPNSNNVKWVVNSNIIQNKKSYAVTFWVVNEQNNMQFVTTKIFTEGIW